MKIAQIAPLIESVPPRLYGGTERVVSYLTEELVRLGHDVTLFASGDSVTSARLVSCATTALRLDPNVRDPIPYYMLMLDRVRDRAADFDVLYFHIDQFHFPLFRTLASRTLTTLHGRQDLPDLRPLYLVSTRCHSSRSQTVSAQQSKTADVALPARRATPRTGRYRAESLRQREERNRRRRSRASTGRPRKPQG
jgi:glycosyltransferase involved in cell wall biosynthesis